MAGPWCSDMWSNITLNVSQGCFWTRLTFKSTDWLKQIALLEVDGPHPVSWRPKQNKDWLPQVRRSLASKQPLAWTSATILSCISNFLPNPIDFQLVSVHNSNGQIFNSLKDLSLKIHTHTQTNTHTLLVLFLWRILSNTLTKFLISWITLWKDNLNTHTHTHTHTPKPILWQKLLKQRTKYNS